MEDLPDELLAEILRLLPPRWIAACRSVCKQWRAAVDASGVLLAVAHLVPGSLRGIFCNYVIDQSLGFFSRAVPPETSSQSSSMDVTLSFLPGELSPCRGVVDHRSGLLLYGNEQGMYVCNPVTRRWATLPAPPGVRPAHRHKTFYRSRMYLMFDPTVSLHYDVLFFPDALDVAKLNQQPGEPQFVLDTAKLNQQPGGGEPLFSRAAGQYYEHVKRKRDAMGSTEWPPYMYPVQVFSSRTSRWEEKQFIRRGDAAGTVSDVLSDTMSPRSSCRMNRNHAVFWRASFYVHCDIGFIMRLSLEEQKYLVIKTPKLNTTGYKRGHTTYGYLGKSKHGVYYTATHGDQLHVWVLHNTSESSQTPEWELKHQVDLEPSFKQHYKRFFRGPKIGKCWVLDSHGHESEDKADYEWDSSDDSVVDTEEGINRGWKDQYHAMDLLGYHPCKEIVFLGNRRRLQGFAYYLDTSKLQHLGSLYPTHLLDTCQFRLEPLLESFIYTPCMDDLLPVQNNIV